VYQLGAQVEKLTTANGGTVTLTAQWKYLVTFVVAGSPNTSKYYTNGTSVDLGIIPVGTPTVEGWYTDANFENS
jgi:hypothetical protein